MGRRKRDREGMLQSTATGAGCFAWVGENQKGDLGQWTKSKRTEGGGGGGAGVITNVFDPHSASATPAQLQREESSGLIFFLSFVACSRRGTAPRTDGCF